MIEQAQSLYAEAEPLIDQAKKEWQTVGPAAQILIDVISHRVASAALSRPRALAILWLITSSYFTLIDPTQQRHHC
jgi:hypothetical protein